VTRITGTSHEDRCTFMIISHRTLLGLRNISDKIVEKIKIHILCLITFFFRKSCHLWDSVEKYSIAVQITDDNIIRRTRIACWISKDTDTHFKCVMLIACPGNNGYAKASLRYVICTLPKLFCLIVPLDISN
jgi:hypothetical protein